MDKTPGDVFLEIGKRLKAIRKSLKLTQEQIYGISGYSKSLISEVEKGKKKPNAYYLLALRNNYNASLEYIFTGNGSMFLGENGDSPGGESPEDEEIKELFRLMKKVKILKYAVLSFYYEYLARNEELIKKNLVEKEP